MNGTETRGGRGRYIERGLLVAILLLQTAILIQLRSSVRRPDPSPAAQTLAPDVAASRHDPEENGMARPVLQGLFHRRRAVDDMDSMMADAMEHAARLHSAVHFQHGWDVLSASPSLDMRGTDSGYMVTFSIPGVLPDELGVLLDGRVLTVRALCGTPAHPGGMRRYERRVLLPGPVGDVEAAQALLTNGVLRLYIPRGAGSSPPRASMRLF